MTDEAWFEDEADAREYLGQITRLWLVWLLGLATLLATRGGVAIAMGAALLVTMFILMSPLQQRVQDRFGLDREARKVAARETLSTRDRALRQLTYGHRPFTEAVDRRGLWNGLKTVPWIVRGATLVAGAAVAVAWFEG